MAFTVAVRRGFLVSALVVAIAGCAPTPGTTDTAASSPPATSEPNPTATPVDVNALPDDFAPIEPGAYSIDPDGDPSTPLRVVYEVPAEGWSQWEGAVKFADDDGHVAVSITTVENVVRQACHNHSPTDPPVGPTVDDLATALTDLAPFKVASPPKNVTIYGYRGKHLELTVPDLPVSHEGFTECLDANLYSWMSPLLGPPGDNAFFGYTGPGYTEEFWILDVEGTRLVIVAGRSPGSAPQDLAELRAILDSIRIEP
jgi:hypothetical protein